MTNLKYSSALGLCWPFCVDRGLPIPLSRGCFVYRTDFSAGRARCLPSSVKSSTSPLNNHGLMINHRRQE